MPPDAESVVLTGDRRSNHRYNLDDDAPELGSPTPERYRCKMPPAVLSPFNLPLKFRYIYRCRSMIWSMLELDMHEHFISIWGCLKQHGLYNIDFIQIMLIKCTLPCQATCKSGAQVKGLLSLNNLLDKTIACRFGTLTNSYMTSLIQLQIVCRVGSQRLKASSLSTCTGMQTMRTTI